MEAVSAYKTKHNSVSFIKIIICFLVILFKLIGGKVRFGVIKNKIGIGGLR